MNKILNWNRALLVLVALTMSTATLATPWSHTPPAPPQPSPSAPQSEATSTSESGAMALSGAEADANAAAIAAQAQKMKMKQKQAQLNLQASQSGAESTVATDASSNTSVNIIEEAAVIPVNTSAAVLPSECASGASGNSRRASFALSNSSSVCDAISLASAYQALGADAKAMAALDKAASMNKAKANWCMFSKVITLGFWPCG